jgi:hypothetical protein
MSKLIPLHGKHGEGKFAIVDYGAYDVVSRVKWRVTSHGYVSTATNDAKTIYLHRVIVGATCKEIVDHIDANKLNNTSANLFKGDKSLNMLNPNNQRPNRKHTSQYKGVYRKPDEKKWRSQIKIGGKHFYLGYFEKESDAGAAYINAKTAYLRGIGYVS